MNLKKLTEKEQRFVEEYCKCSNKSEAYQIAFLKDSTNINAYHRQANKLLGRSEIQQAIFMQQISLEKNSDDYNKNLTCLRNIRDKSMEKLEIPVKKDSNETRLNYVAMEGALESIKQINEMLGLTINNRMDIFIKMQELNLKFATLEFKKSKIVKDNEELEKKNISLLDQLANSIKQRRENREKEQEISSNVT